MQFVEVRLCHTGEQHVAVIVNTRCPKFGYVKGMAPLLQYWSLASFHLKLRQLRGGARSIYTCEAGAGSMFAP